MEKVRNRFPREAWLMATGPLICLLTLIVQLSIASPSFIINLDQIRGNLCGVVCAALAYLGYQWTSPRDSPLKAWFLTGWALFLLGQSLWLVRALLPGFHTILAYHLLMVCLPSCLYVGICLTLYRGLGTAMGEAAIFLDILSIGITTLILSLTFLVPDQGSTPLFSNLLTEAYPPLCLLCLEMLFLTILLKQLPLTIPAGLILLGLLGQIISSFLLNLDLLHGREIGGSPGIYSLTLSAICLAIGSSYWSSVPSSNPTYVRRCLSLQRLIPLLLVVAAAGCMLPGRHPNNRLLHSTINGGSLLIVVLAIIRQGLLLFEKESKLQSQRKLFEQEANLRTLIEYSNDVIFHIAVESEGTFRYLMISQGFEKLMEEETTSIVGKTPQDFFSAATAHKLITNYQKCADSGTAIRYEQLVTTLKKAVWVDTMLLPLRNSQDQVIQLIGVFRNITASKSDLEAIKRINLELKENVKSRTKELETTNREMEIFSHSVSHDLRIPLQAINGFCRSLREDYPAVVDDPAKEYLQRIQTASERMSHIIDDLLELSQASRSRIEWNSVNLSELATGIASNLKLLDPFRKVTFSIANNLMSFGDLRLLELMMDNLLGNAWKYSSKNPLATIEFGTFLEENETVYFVKDDGAGFDMLYVDKLFQAFQRLHDRTEFEGTGIGLAIVSRIIERHQGRVWANSVIGAGATFYFTLGAKPASIADSL